MSEVHYTVIIQWSAEDQCYVASLPEWGDLCKAHGKTYEDAAKNAREVLELLLKDEVSPPAPKLFRYPGADVVDRPMQPLRSTARPAVA